MTSSLISGKNTGCTHLVKDEAADNAMEQFERWWQDALKSEIDEVNAMTLATASADGLPAARIVLLKGYHEEDFSFIPTMKVLKENSCRKIPEPAWFSSGKNWKDRFALPGLVEKLSEKESNDYFRARPEGSRIGAWASPQSKLLKAVNG